MKFTQLDLVRHAANSVELLIILIFCVFIQVIALKGSYHGDTLGAMEAQAPSSYTGFLQQPWYGYFIRKAFMRTDLPNLKFFLMED